MLKSILYFFGGCLLIGLIFSFAIRLFFPPLPSITAAFLASVQIEKYESAHHLMSSRFKNDISLEKFVETLKKARIAKNKKFKIVSKVKNEEKGTGVITVIVVANDNTEIPLELHFVLEEGVWKINSLSQSDRQQLQRQRQRQ